MRSSERLGDPRKCVFRDALPAEVQVCDVKAANGDLRWLRSVFAGRQYPPPDGFVLHQLFCISNRRTQSQTPACGLEQQQLSYSGVCGPKGNNQN